MSSGIITTLKMINLASMLENQEMDIENAIKEASNILDDLHRTCKKASDEKNQLHALVSCSIFETAFENYINGIKAGRLSDKELTAEFARYLRNMAQAIREQKIKMQQYYMSKLKI
jgi:hypothetical protein